MKTWLIGIAVGLLLVIVAVLVLPSLIPTAIYAARIEAAVKSETGRTLTIKGPVRLSVLPHLALEADDVALASPAGFAEPQMLRIARLHLVVQPLAYLLSGALVVDSFVLDRPRIVLAIDKAGRPNWPVTPLTPAGGAAPPPAGAPPPASGAPPSRATVARIHLGDVRLVDGSLRYLDERTGTARQVDKIDAQISLPDLASPMTLRGSARWNGQAVGLDLGLAQPGAFLSGTPSPVRLTATSGSAKLDVAGQVTVAAAVSFAGTVRAALPDLRAFAVQSGISLPATQGGLRTLAIDGRLDLAGGRLAMTQVAIALDRMKATGNLMIEAGSGKPTVSGALAIDRLDLDPYLPPAATGPAATAPKAAPADGGGPARPGPAAAAPDGWSDLSLLKRANLGLSLSAGGIAYRTIAIGPSVLALRLQEGRLVLDLQRMALYGGSATGRLQADGATAVPGLAAALDLTKVQAEPLLAGALGFDRLSGTASGTVSLAAHGGSEQALIATLGGKGVLQLTDGAIRGIDLPALIANPQKALMHAAAQQTAQTRFTQLSGTFTIADGILRNDDLVLAAPGLQAGGAGRVDLVQRRVDYRLSPKVGGNPVPVLVVGPWDDLTYRPDLGALLGNPKVQQSIEKLLGGKSKPGSPAELLKGLLGGGK